MWYNVYDRLSGNSDDVLLIFLLLFFDCMEDLGLRCCFWGLDILFLIVYLFALIGLGALLWARPVGWKFE